VAKLEPRGELQKILNYKGEFGKRRRGLTHKTRTHSGHFRLHTPQVAWRETARVRAWWKGARRRREKVKVLITEAPSRAVEMKMTKARRGLKNTGRRNSKMQDDNSCSVKRRFLT